jgi:hypothetical protein
MEGCPNGMCLDAHWQFGVALFLSLWVLSFMVAALATAWNSGRSRKEINRDRRISALANSLWLSFVVILGIVWLWSVCDLDRSYMMRRNYAEVLLYLAGVSFILFLTFLLEGVELAFTSLSDKEEAQVSRPGTFKLIREHRKDFYEAREWCMVAMVVTITLIVDREEYAVPFIGSFRTSNPFGLALRYLVTFGLTTFPLVWVAQSPAKELASTNSDHFLQLAFTELAVRLVTVVRKVVSVFRLRQPSEMFTEIYERIAPGLAEPRRLPPGELKFFTDSLKKYGYAVISGRDSIKVSDDGSCNFCFRSLVYIGSPRSQFSRNIEFDGKVRSDRLDVRSWLFEIDEIGETVEDELGDWFHLFENGSPRNASIRPISTVGFSVNEVTHINSERPRGEKRTVTIQFPYFLPREDRKNHKKAVLLLAEICGEAGSPAFCAPNDLSDDAPELEDYYFKKYMTPCLRSHVLVELAQDSLATLAMNKHSVSFDNVELVAESMRFSRMQEVATCLTSYKELSEQTGGINENGTRLSVFLESALPGAEYQTRWHLRRASR